MWFTFKLIFNYFFKNLLKNNKILNFLFGNKYNKYIKNNENLIKNIEDLNEEKKNLNTDLDKIKNSLVEIKNNFNSNVLLENGENLNKKTLDFNNNFYKFLLNKRNLIYSDDQIKGLIKY
jgi:uncharacterized protein YpuA (DUF1002 family)